MRKISNDKCSNIKCSISSCIELENNANMPMYDSAEIRNMRITLSLELLCQLSAWNHVEYLWRNHSDINGSTHEIFPRAPICSSNFKSYLSCGYLRVTGSFYLACIQLNIVFHRSSRLPSLWTWDIVSRSVLNGVSICHHCSKAMSVIIVFDSLSASCSICSSKANTLHLSGIIMLYSH